MATKLLTSGRGIMVASPKKSGGMSKAAIKAQEQLASLRGRYNKLKDSTKDNVADLSKPAAGAAGAALAGAIRGMSFTAEGGEVIERRVFGVLPYDVVVSTGLAVTGLFSEPDKAGRLLTHMGMGGLAGRIYLGVSEAVGEHRLGDAWTGGKPVEIVEES